MIFGILLQAQRGVRSWGSIALALYVFIVGLVIICLMRVARYFGSAGKQQKLIRMELTKLAEEVARLRQNLEQTKENDGPADAT